MTMDRTLNLSDQAGGTARLDIDAFDRDAGHSNYMAFVLGGLMISLGLLAFTFYDNGAPMSRDVTMTGSVTPRLEQPVSPARP